MLQKKGSTGVRNKCSAGPSGQCNCFLLTPFERVVTIAVQESDLRCPFAPLQMQQKCLLSAEASCFASISRRSAIRFHPFNSRWDVVGRGELGGTWRNMGELVYTDYAGLFIT